MSRRRSHWGWGWEDKLLDTEARGNVGALIAGLMGVDAPEPAPLPDPKVLSLPSPRVSLPGRIAHLSVPDDYERALHTYGCNFEDLHRGFHGDFGLAPDLVVQPTTEDEVAACLDWASSNDVVVVPFGGGTSVVGGVTAPRHDRPTMSLDLTRLDQVLEVQPESLLARIQGGASGPGLEQQLAPHGLSLRHYPQSFEFSTLGGWIATRAGGHYATLYTHIDERVASVRMLTPRGSWESRTLPGSGAGPSPDRMVIGSEGILGVITEAWMRVVRRPVYRSRATASFADLPAAIPAVRAISQAGLYPANCRLLDANEARYNGVRFDGRAQLVLAFESADHPLEPWMARALELVQDHGGQVDAASVRHTEARSDSRAEGEANWREAFIEAPYMLNTLTSLGFVVETMETACTWDRFEALHLAVSAAARAVFAEAGGGILNVRFTHVYPDGPAPYFTCVTPGGAAPLERWRALKAGMSQAMIDHGGTITHHHAVGRTHRPWYDQQRPELFAEALRVAKGAVDPQGVLNPGVLIDP